MKKSIFYNLIFSLVLSGVGSLIHAVPEPFQGSPEGRNPSAVARMSKECWEGSKIMGASILAAIAYGIGNDQVTARVCPEYFTQGFHKYMLQHNAWHGDKLAARMLQVTNPTKLGLYWGIAATWWFGALLGVPTALAARVGSWPKLGMKDLIKPLGVGLASLYAMAAAAGGYGYMASKNGWLSEDFRRGLANAAGNTPASAMHRYTADAFAHHVGYFGGALVAAGLIGWTIHERYKRAQQAQRDPIGNAEIEKFVKKKPCAVKVREGFQKKKI